MTENVPVDPTASPAAPVSTPVATVAQVVAPQAAAPEVKPAPPISLPPPASGVFLGTGRRKTSIARIRVVKPGTGKITVNGKPLEERFNRVVHLEHIREPLRVTQTDKIVDVLGDVFGGGVTGQAGALRHGIARAILAMFPDYRRPLRRAGCLTRDPRAKERRKCGLKKARKAEQYSKR